MTRKMPADAILRQLPPLLREVADLVGVDGALSIATEFGGREQRIPLKATPDCVIARACGLAAAEALVELRGGSKTYIPRAPMALGLAGRPQARGPFWRDGKLAEAIAAMAAEGMSRNEIARALGTSRRWVYATARRIGAVPPAA